MHVAICALRLFVSGCILQFLDAAAGDEKLPFEVDVNSDAVDFGNVGLNKRISAGNRLTWQASKQGENFVASPKPASTQGFSFNEEQPSSDLTSTPSKVTQMPTPKLTKTQSASSAAGGASAVGSKHGRGDGNLFWSHFHPWSSPSFGRMNPFGPGFPLRRSNPFQSNFSFGKSDPFDSSFPFDKSDPFDSFPFKNFDSATTNPLGSTSPGGDWRSFRPSAPFNDYGFQQSTMPSMMPSLDDMKLVEDRILDDENGKGRFRTYLSKDGNAMVQLLHRKGELVRNSNRVGRFQRQGERYSYQRPHFRRNAFNY